MLCIFPSIYVVIANCWRIACFFPHEQPGQIDRLFLDLISDTVYQTASYEGGKEDGMEWQKKKKKRERERK